MNVPCATLGDFHSPVCVARNSHLMDFVHVERIGLLVMALLYLDPESRFGVVFLNESRLVSHMNNFFPRPQKHNIFSFFVLFYSTP